MSENVKIYVAHAMTGRFRDELVQEARMVKHALNNHGFDVLDPIEAEGIAAVHEPLEQVDAGILEHHWRRDKIMIKEADLLLDYKSCNKSDGVAKEIGYVRFCLWKPVVRVYPGAPVFSISRIEDDFITDNLGDAITYITKQYGTYEKLGEWRKTMLTRSLDRWLSYQDSIDKRYGIGAYHAIH